MSADDRKNGRAEAGSTEVKKIGSAEDCKSKKPDPVYLIEINLNDGGPPLYFSDRKLSKDGSAEDQKQNSAEDRKTGRLEELLGAINCAPTSALPRFNASRLIYIAGPYTARDKYALRRNILRAERAGREVMMRGHVPVIPHSIGDAMETGNHFAHFGHKDWLERLCLPLLDRCDGIFMLNGWRSSRGARMEFDFAFNKGIPIFYDMEEIRF